MEQINIVDFNKFFEFGITGVVILVLILIIGFLLHWVRSMAHSTVKYQQTQIENTTRVITENTETVRANTQAVKDIERTVIHLHAKAHPYPTNNSNNGGNGHNT